MVTGIPGRCDNMSIPRFWTRSMSPLSSEVPLSISTVARRRRGNGSSLWGPVPHAVHRSAHAFAAFIRHATTVRARRRLLCTSSDSGRIFIVFTSVIFFPVDFFSSFTSFSQAVNYYYYYYYFYYCVVVITRAISV